MKTKKQYQNSIHKIELATVALRDSRSHLELERELAYSNYLRYKENKEKDKELIWEELYDLLENRIYKCGEQIDKLYTTEMKLRNELIVLLNGEIDSIVEPLRKKYPKAFKA